MNREQSVIDLVREIDRKETEVKRLRERLAEVIGGASVKEEKSPRRTRCMDAKEQIVQILAEAPSKSFSREAVSRKLRISASSAGFHLSELTDAGLVQRISRGVYRAAPGKTSNGART